MALGTILREAREQQGYSVAQVAEATHMMTQIVEELEREDFHRIAAPIYGRGFVKLYADFLKIDAEPLVKEFNEIFSGSRRPVIATRAVPPAPSSETRREGSGGEGSGGEGSGFRVQDSGVEPAGEPTLSRALSTGTAEPAGTTDPSQPLPTPPNPEISPSSSISPSAPSRLGVSALKSPAPAPASRVSADLDDLFGPRPSPAPERRASAASAPSVAPVSRHSPLPTHHSPLTTHFSAPLRLRASALKLISAPLRLCASALKSALPAGWRTGPVLAGAAAGLLVIAVCIVIVLRAQHRTPEQSALERSALPATVSPLTVSPLTTHHSPLTIRTILPPPEPYID